MKSFGTAIILAGGQSSRMGFDKQFLEIDEKKLMDSIISRLETKFEEIIIVTNKPEEYKELNHKIISDIIVCKGPLSGIHAGLTESSSKYSFVIACDMPNINISYIDYMQSCIEGKDIDGCVTIYKDNLEPFISFYSKDIIKDIEKYLGLGRRSLHQLLRSLQIHYIEEKIARKFTPNWDMFLNLNTIEDLSLYTTKLK
jgi:molybdopterin-guanine dinucleotide biosynthesis protein A